MTTSYEIDSWFLGNAKNLLTFSAKPNNNVNRKKGVQTYHGEIIG